MGAWETTGTGWDYSKKNRIAEAVLHVARRASSPTVRAGLIISVGSHLFPLSSGAFLSRGQLNRWAVVTLQMLPLPRVHQMMDLLSGAPEEETRLQSRANG